MVDKQITDKIQRLNQIYSKYPDLIKRVSVSGYDNARVLSIKDLDQLKNSINTEDFVFLVNAVSSLVDVKDPVGELPYKHFLKDPDQYNAFCKVSDSYKDSLPTITRLKVNSGLNKDKDLRLVVPDPLYYFNAYAKIVDKMERNKDISDDLEEYSVTLKTALSTSVAVNNKTADKFNISTQQFNKKK